MRQRINIFFTAVIVMAVLSFLSFIGGLAVYAEENPYEYSEEENGTKTTTVCFSYSGSVKTWTVPADGLYTIELWGAQGGADNAWYTEHDINKVLGGMGGYVSAEVELKKGEVLYINVGGAGTHAGNDVRSYYTDSVTGATLLSSRDGAGWNGGGAPTSSSGYGPSGGGGGATDVRLGDNNIDSRFIVAGGGGGTSGYAPGEGGGRLFYDGVQGRMYIDDVAADETAGSLQSYIGRSMTAWKFYGQDQIQQADDGYDSGAGGGGGYYGGFSALDGSAATGGTSFVGSPDDTSKRRLTITNIVHAAGVKVTDSPDFLSRLNADEKFIGAKIPKNSRSYYGTMGISYELRGHYIKEDTGWNGYAKISYSQTETDTKPPVITVTPSTNTDWCNSISVTITASDTGESGLFESTDRNQYFLSASSSVTVEPDSRYTYDWPSGTVTLGTGLNGTYYLYVRSVNNKAGSWSSNGGTVKVMSNGVQYQMFGPYKFDNTAPAGSASYYENNETLGLYDSKASEPYAVIEINNAVDALSGVDKVYLEIADKADASNSTRLYFDKTDAGYRCEFNLYTALSGNENIETVSMSVHAVDKAGNDAKLSISTYDFGTDSYGTVIPPEAVGFKPDGSGGYERDDFRIEARLFDKNGSSTFLRGSKAFLEIYTFGYVETVSAGLTSLHNQIDSRYDTEVNLQRTAIEATDSSLYIHTFFVPLYAEERTYNDNYVKGFKGSLVQTRGLSMTVSGTILDNIKTILK